MENQEQEKKELEIKTIDELQAVFDSHLLLEDRHIVKLICASILSNQFRGDPTWLFIVASSSGGKSEIIQAFDSLRDEGGNQLVFPISDMTANAFASGQKKIGKETSLLHKMPPGGILSYKDFTSMVSKQREARAELFKQLREIYDGQYNKKTGTGDNIEWKGKIGAIAGATEVIYEYQQDFSTMGDRFVMYSMVLPDRRKVLDFIMDDSRVNADRQAMRQELQDATNSYMEMMLQEMQEEDVNIHPDLKEDLKDVADFCTQVRSGVVVDERRPNIVNFAPSAEMPMRMMNQLTNICRSFIIMRKTEARITGKQYEQKDGYDIITDDEAKLIYKIAFDSIPIKRRMALKALTKYGLGATTKGLATSINYQTPVVNAWLSQLNAMKICKREQKGGNQGDKWTLYSRYRDIMVKFEHIEVIDEELIDESEDEEEALDEAWNTKSELDKQEEMASLDANSDYDPDFGF